MLTYAAPMNDRGGGPPGPRARDAGLAVLLYVALTFVLAWPFSVTPASSVLWAGPDTELFLWTLAWDVHAFTAQPLAIFDANIFHPLRHTLAYSENLIGSAIVAAPVLWTTGNLVLAMNAVSLVSVVLCGAGTYMLARQVGVGHGGAILAGLVFAFSPPRFFRISQLHLNAVQWMPFALAFLHRYFDHGRPRDLRLAAACYSLQALSSGHGAVFLTVASAGLTAWRLASGMPLALPRRLRDLGAAGAILLLPAVLVTVPYAIVQDEVGLKRPYTEEWSSNPASFLASPAHVPSFVLSVLGGARIRETADAFLFPGYLPLLLAALLVLPRGLPAADRSRERATASFYVALVGVSLLLAIGPPFSLWRFVYWMPGFNFIRAPSRFTMLALLGLAVLAGMGFDRLRSRLPPARARLAAILACAALVAEFTAVPLVSVPYRLEIPSADRWLALQPGRFAIAEMPPPGIRGSLPTPRLQTVYMLHSTAHWQKTIHGQSGIEPRQHTELFSQLLGFPDERSLQALERFGVRYLVVHEDLYPRGEWEGVEARIQSMPDRLALEYRSGEGRVYSLRSGP